MTTGRLRAGVSGLLLALATYGGAATGRADAPTETLFRVRSNGLWGFVDRAGRVVIQPRFDAAEPFSEGLAAVRIGERHAYVDSSGRIAIEPVFAPAAAMHRPFSNGRAAVRANGKLGYIDRNGALAIPARFIRADDFSEGFALVCDAADCTYVDVSGKGVVSAGPMGGAPVHGGMGTSVLAMAMSRERVELVDVAARRRVEGAFDGLGVLSEGLIAARVGSSWGYVDRKGRGVIAPAFEAAGDFAEGLAAVRFSSGLCGYIDRRGKPAIPPRFGKCHRFSSGRARVDLAIGDLEGERIAFIDAAGKVVISGADAKPPFDSAEDFVDGLAAVGRGGEPRFAGTGPLLGYIDAQGNYVWPPTD